MSVTAQNTVISKPTALTGFISNLSSHIGILSLAILYVAVVIVVLDAVIIISDVIGRILFAHPIIGTVELVRNTVVLIIFCQAPATIMEGRMLRVSAILVRLPKGGIRMVEILTCLLGISLFAALAADMWEPMIHAWRIHEMDGTINLKMPLAPVRTALVVLWIYTAIVLFYTLVRTALGLETNVPADAVAH